MEGTRPPLPLGCKFQPSDEQLVQFYLFNKISGTPAPFLDDFVRTENLYGSKEPWQIWRQFGGPDLEAGEDLYFFTRLKKKSVNGSRIDRRVGSGTWQGEDAGKAIVSRNSRKKIGSKKRFRYEKDKSPHSGCWIMHEYALNPSLLPQNLQCSDLVLCRIRKNGEPAATGQKYSRKNRKLDQPVVEEDIDQPAELVVVEEHQHQCLQETQPQPSTELAPHNHLQLFQSHQLMQRTPAYFFRAQEENYQQSMSQQHPHDLELSEQHECSVENHQYMGHQSSNIEDNQQLPALEHNLYDQLEQSVERHQSMLPNPSNFQENQQLPGTEQSLYDQLDQTIENHQQMLQTPLNIEGCQDLLAFDDSLQCLLDSSDDNLRFDINDILNEGRME